MTQTPPFRMNTDSEDRERLEARVRANARDFARVAGDGALISLLASLLYQTQKRQAGRGRVR